MSYGRNIKRIAQHIHRRNANRFFHDLRSKTVMFLLVRLISEDCQDHRALTVNRGESEAGRERDSCERLDVPPNHCLWRA